MAVLAIQAVLNDFDRILGQPEGTMIEKYGVEMAKNDDLLRKMVWWVAGKYSRNSPYETAARHYFNWASGLRGNYNSRVAATITNELIEGVLLKNNEGRKLGV